jgi:hypothetical protein
MTFTRHLHPCLKQTEIWPGPAGYPWANTGVPLWTREALLRPLGDGHLLCTWTTGGMTEPWAGNLTMACASTDNGATWTTPEILFAHPVRGLFTTELFVPRPGEIHAFLQTYANGVWMSQLLSYRSISLDAGQNWSGPHSLPGGVQSVWVGRGIICNGAGRWVLPVSWAELIGDEWAPPSVSDPTGKGRVGLRSIPQEILPADAADMLLYQAGNAWSDRNHRYVCGVIISDDDGKTFRLHGYLRGGKRGWLIEPRVVELSDGSLRMLIRSQHDGWLWQSTSDDAGLTWTVPICSTIPNPSAKICLLRARDGRIFLIHNPTTHQGEIMGGRNPLSLWVSHDDMRSWAIKVDLVRDENPSANLNYPDGFLDEERGELVLVWEDTYSVFLLRVPMDTESATL